MVSFDPVPFENPPSQILSAPDDKHSVSTSDATLYPSRSYSFSITIFLLIGIVETASCSIGSVRNPASVPISRPHALLRRQRHLRSCSLEALTSTVLRYEFVPVH